MGRKRDTTITFTCDRCGASYFPWQSRHPAKTHYCSAACRNAAQAEQIGAARALSPRVCPYCHRSFRPARGKQVYCSRVCAAGAGLAALRTQQHTSKTTSKVARKRIPRIASATPVAVTPKPTPTSTLALPTTWPDALELLPAEVQEPAPASIVVPPLPEVTPGGALAWPIESEADRREWHQVGQLRQAQADQFLTRIEPDVAGSPGGRTVILAGQGSFLGVELGDLIVHSGRTHGPPAPEREVLHPALHDVRRILWAGINDRMGGTMTMAALAWCRREGVQVTVLDGSGMPLMSSWPSDPLDAPLRQKQWAVHDSTRLAGALAREIVRMTADAQATTLEAHSNQLPGAAKALEQFRVWQAWLSLPKPPPWLVQVDRLRIIEARLAGLYFNAWLAMSLPFSKTDAPRLPSHWLVARERNSPLSPQGNARRSVDPLNSLLNYAYSVAASQVRQSLVASGLDVCAGYLHSDQKGRDSLVWDMVELERATVDHLVLTLLDKTTLHRADFLKDKGGLVTLHPQTVRLVLAACRVPQAQVDGHARWLADWIRNAEQITAITAPTPETQD